MDALAHLHLDGSVAVVGFLFAGERFGMPIPLLVNIVDDPGLLGDAVCGPCSLANGHLLSPPIKHQFPAAWRALIAATRHRSLQNLARDRWNVILPVRKAVPHF